MARCGVDVFRVRELLVGRTALRAVGVHTGGAPQPANRGRRQDGTRRHAIDTAGRPPASPPGSLWTSRAVGSRRRHCSSSAPNLPTAPGPALRACGSPIPVRSKHDPSWPADVTQTTGAPSRPRTRSPQCRRCSSGDVAVTASVCSGSAERSGWSSVSARPLAWRTASSANAVAMARLAIPSSIRQFSARLLVGPGSRSGGRRGWRAPRGHHRRQRPACLEVRGRSRRARERDEALAEVRKALRDANTEREDGPRPGSRPRASSSAPPSMVERRNGHG